MKPFRAARPRPLGLERLEERAAPAANLYVSADGASPLQVLKEYTQQGALVQSLTIPPGGTQQDARDLIAGADGRIHVFNGAAEPYLSTYDPAAGTWGHRTYAGWSAWSAYNGVGIYQNYVFATDNYTSGNATNEKGIIRFNLSDGSATRFASDFEPQDLAVGRDGLVYAMEAWGGINVYNPDTLAFVRTLTLPTSIAGASQFYTGLAVNSNGDIYACTSSNRLVHRFDANGAVLGSISVTNGGTSIGWLYDIDISADGTQLAVGTSWGNVALMSSNLTGLTWFATGNSAKVFVAFAPEPTPMISISDVSVTEGNTGTATATFNVSLSVSSTQTVTVDWATGNGTATAGSDYTSGSGTVTFAPGETSKTIAVDVLGDVQNEGNETFTVSLSGATGAPIADGAGTGTILDDEVPPAIGINEVSVTEGHSGTVSVVFAVSLSAASTQTVTVNWATAAGTATADVDFESASGILTFAPGETSKTVSVAVIGDTLDELSESFTVNLSGAINATIADSQGAGGIADDDAAAASINDVSVTEGDSGSLNATFTVTLATVSDHAISVEWSTANGTATSGSDYTTAGGTLTFAAGETSKTINVAVLGDVGSELTETFVVNLDSGTSGVADGQGVGTILDTDLPALAIGDVTVTEGTGGTTNAAFTVTMPVPSTQTVTVDWATADGTAVAGPDYTAASGTLTFGPGETSKTVTVAVLADGMDEPHENFSVNLANVVNATIGDGQGVGTITDDDAVPTLAINDVSVVESAVQAVFTVTLSAASGWTVSVDYSTQQFTAQSGFDFTATSGTLSFAPGETSKTIAVNIVNDTSMESDERFFVNLSGVVHAGYADGTGQATIVNDDFIMVSINDVSVTEDDYGSVTATFTVSLSETWTSAIVVDWATANGTAVADSQYSFGDYEARDSFIIIGAGETSKTLTVTVLGDTKHETNETFLVNLSNPSVGLIGDGQGVCTIIDNDPHVLTVADVTVSESADAAVFIVNLSQPSTETVTVNYATSDLQTTAGADYLGANGTLTFAPGETSKSVSVSLINDNTDEMSEEIFYFDLSGAVNAKPGFVRAYGRIQDDDNAPVITINDPFAIEGDSGVSHAVFTISLSNPSASTVDVYWLTANGTAVTIWDYGMSGGNMVFNPGQTVKTVSIPVYSELHTEPDETFFVNLSTPTNATIGDSQGAATIVSDDLPPVANAGSDQTVNEGALVSFNGGGSSDPDGDALTYLWNFGDGTTADIVAPTHAYVDNATYVVTLKVFDGHGGVGTDTIIVTANNVAPTTTITGPAGGVRGQVRTYTFAAADTSSADMAAAFTYEINWGDGNTQSVSGQASGVTVDHIFTAAGNFGIAVTATDKDGGVGAPATLAVNISAAQVQGSDLIVGGTASTDTITVSRVNGSVVRAVVNGQNLGSFNVSGTVVVNGQAGNDLIQVTGSNFPRTVQFFGDAGNDTLDARNGAPGAILVGGEGDDELLGGAGRDLLFGGLGADALRGGGNSDILIGGITDHDANRTALTALADEWRRNDVGLATRIGHLDGSQSGGLNGSDVLNATTVHDDAKIDELYGESGADWFIYAGNGPYADHLNDWGSGDVGLPL